MTHIVINFAGGTNCYDTTLSREVEPLFCHVFGVDQLVGLFDHTPAAEALPKLEEAYAYMVASGPALKELLPADDWQGVRGNAHVLAGVRNIVRDNPDAVVTWLPDVIPNPT